MPVLMSVPGEGEVSARLVELRPALGVPDLLGDGPVARFATRPQGEVSFTDVDQGGAETSFESPIVESRDSEIDRRLRNQIGEQRRANGLGDLWKASTSRQTEDQEG